MSKVFWIAFIPIIGVIIIIFLYVNDCKKAEKAYKKVNHDHKRN